MKITGKRIYLKKLKLANATLKYCNWLNDAEVNKYLKTKYATIKDLRKYIAKKNKSKNCFFLGIFDKKNNEHIGNLKLEPINFKKKKAIFGILIGNKSYWNKGIGTEVIKLAINYAFNNFNIKEIELQVLPKNKIAIKVYKKCGFKINRIVMKLTKIKFLKQKNIYKEEIKTNDIKT